MSADLFDLTHRPDSDLFYHRNDPNDRRLGDVVSADPAHYQGAEVVILGCPQDEGVRRNGGRVGAAQAPNAIRRCLYKLTINHIETLNIYDLGNMIIHDSLEATHDAHQQIVRQVIADGKTLIMLGGGNDVSYPDCAALAQVEANLLAFNVDAHYDVRADTPRNSGTPYRQLLDEGLISPANFYEIGSQPFANSPTYTRYLQDIGATVIALPDLRVRGISAAFGQILGQSSAKAIFWGLDMDVVRASDAPGVSAPNPTGLSGDELCQIAQIAGADRRSRILEISEVNPQYDIDQRTCRLAAVTIYHFLFAFAARK